MRKAIDKQLSNGLVKLHLPHVEDFGCLQIDFARCADSYIRDGCSDFDLYPSIYDYELDWTRFYTNQIDFADAGPDRTGFWSG